MRRNVIVILGMLFLVSIQPVYSQESNVDLEPVLEQVKLVLSDKDYQDYSETIKNMHFDQKIAEGTAQKTAGLLDEVEWPFIVAAYLFDWVNPNFYIWNGKEYEIRASISNSTLPPWSGFWVRANRNVELYIAPWKDDPIPGSGDTMQLTMQDNTYYFISPPLVPVNDDIGVNFASDLAPGVFEQTARISKWNSVTGEYDRYTAPGTLPGLKPGRGYWAYHILGEPKTLTITGSKSSSNWLYLPANGNTPGDHMCGNPFHYDMHLWMLFVKSVDNSDVPVAKIAVDNGSIFENLESWHVDLKLASPGGEYLDTFNRAGVIESGADIHEKLSAVDMPVMGDNIRLAILNDESDTGRYAFDFRSPGAEEYVWDVELTTTLDQVTAALSIENIATVPADYILALIDNNGNEIPVNSDATFTVNLTGNEPKTYQLKATRTNPTEVAEASIPDAVRITGVSPNPFNPSTTLSFDLDTTGAVSVKVFNISGQLVATLADGVMQAGSHSLTWDASGQSSGIYLVTVGSNGINDYRKVTLLK